MRFLRNTVFLGALLAGLAASSLSLGLWALSLSAQVATVSAGAAAAALRHRKELAHAVARTKAKARLRRALVAVPVVGLGSLVYFEEQDYREWLEENPGGDRTAYLCEMAALTAEVMDEVLQDLPEALRPAAGRLRAQGPDCATAAPAEG
jgi:hypothetical protein